MSLLKFLKTFLAPITRVLPIFSTKEPVRGLFGRPFRVRLSSAFNTSFNAARSRKPIFSAASSVFLYRFFQVDLITVDSVSAPLRKH